MTTPTTAPRWVFDDGAGDVYSFAVSPNRMTSPWFDVNVTASPTTAPDGQMIVTEGRRSAKEFTISGTVLGKAQNDELLKWLRKRRRVFLTDHFGRRMTVFIRSFSPVPARRISYKHTYDMTMLVLSEPVDFVNTGIV